MVYLTPYVIPILPEVQHSEEIQEQTICEYQYAKNYYFNNATKDDGNVYLKADFSLAKGLNAYADLQYRHITYHLNIFSFHAYKVLDFSIS